MDTELAQAQWTQEERLLSIHLDGTDRSRYWCDENEEEYLDALYNVI
jgi:cytosine/adenosine deaminase-related metal-dependent hydrolase